MVEQSHEELQELFFQEMEKVFEMPVINSDGFSVKKYAKDYQNTFLITNPTCLNQVFDLPKFKSLSPEGQLNVLCMLEDLLAKCEHNSQLLASTCIPLESQNTSREKGQDDILMKMLKLALSSSSHQVQQKLQDIVKQLAVGRYYNRSHLKLVLDSFAQMQRKDKKVSADDFLQKQLILSSLIDSKIPNQEPLNYFYFSGLGSGIKLNQINLDKWPFTGGFSIALWFSLEEQTSIHEDKLPILFNCYSQGYGGFECYVVERKLFYRIIPKNQYSVPTVNSNGICLGEFQHKKFYFLSIEHNKPQFSRAQLDVVVNNRHTLKMNMDYPKFDKKSILTSCNFCQDLIGQCSSILLFEEQVGDPQKFIKMYNQYPTGLSSNQQIKNLSTEVFDKKLGGKIYLAYSPARVSGSLIYDCVNFYDAQLGVNCHYSNFTQPLRLKQYGNLSTLLPIFDIIVKNSEKWQQDEESIKPFQILNSLLKLVSNLVSQNLTGDQQFFKVLFFLISKLGPKNSVDTNTVSILADIRFSLQEPKSQQAFFRDLMESNQFWIKLDQEDAMAKETQAEFWGFVKAVYEQDPLAYLNIFGIQKMIDLMLNLSQDCCQFHKAVLSQQQPLEEGPEAPQNLTLIVKIIESVLIQGGNEILPQIEHISKALATKSSPCFQLQLLTLLKTLLIDNNHPSQLCASPLDFATAFIEAKGLQVLLYLFSHFSLDVKSMCVKLINVLSSQTDLIKMRIDTELITYLCNSMVPRASNQRKQTDADQDDKEDDPDEENWMLIESSSQRNSILAAPKQKSLNMTQKLKISEINEKREKPVFKKKKLVLAVEEEQEEEEKKEEQVEKEPLAPVVKKETKKKGINLLNTQRFQLSSLKTEEQEVKALPALNQPKAPMPPSIRNKKGPLQLDLKSEEEEDTKEEETKSFNPPKPARKQKKTDFFTQQPEAREAMTERMVVHQQKNEFANENVMSKSNLRKPKKFDFSLSSEGEEEEEAKDMSKTLNTQEDTEIVKEKEDLILPKPGGGKKDFKAFGKKTMQLGKIGLAIDTEAINDMFTFGGEKGELLISENEEVRMFVQEIDDLAKQCVAAMQRKSPSQPIQIEGRTAFDNRYLMLEGAPDNKNFIAGLPTSKNVDQSKKSFNKPQRVKGIKSIDRDAKVLEVLDKEHSIIYEEDQHQLSNNSQIQHSSQSSKAQEFSPNMLSNLSPSQDLNSFRKEIEDQIISDQKKQASPFQQPGEIEEGEYYSMSQADKQMNEGTRTKPLDLYTSCLEWILNRVPSHLKSQLFIDDVDKICFQPALSLIMNLVTSTSNLVRQRALQDLQMLAKWDTQNGNMMLAQPQFHQWLLELLLPYQHTLDQGEELKQAALAVYDMGCKLHTNLILNSCQSPEEEAYKKLNFLVRWPAIVEKQEQEQVKVAKSLVRVLVSQICQKLRETVLKNQPSVNQTSTAWRNATYMACLVEEFVLISKQDQSQNSFREPQGFNDVNSSLLKWLEQGYLNTQQKEGGTHSWLDFQMVQAYVQMMEPLIQDEIYGFTNQQEILSKVTNILDSDQDSQREIEVLLFDNIQPMDRKQSQMSNQSSNQQTQNQNDSQNFLKSYLNLVCISIKKAPTTELAAQMLKRIQKLAILLITSSERLKSKNQYLCQQVQKKFSEALAFIFSFLFREMHAFNMSSTKSVKSQGTFQSPKNDEISAKTFAIALKNMFIALITVHHHTKRNTDTGRPQVWLQFIKESLLKYDKEPLLSSTDLDRMFQNNFEDFPECFHLEVWKFTFFNGQKLQEISKRQLSFEYTLQVLSQKRQGFARYMLQLQTQNEKTKEDILKRMQGRLMDVLAEVSEKEFERKNQTIVEFEYRSKEKQKAWRKFQKKSVQGNSIWNDPSIETGTSVSQVCFQDGSMSLLKPKYKPGFTYNTQSDEKLFSDENLQNISKFNQKENLAPMQSTLTQRERLQMKNSYLKHLKNIYLSQKQNKPKEIMEFKCSLMNPFIAKTGTVCLTSHEIVFFYDIVHKNNQEQQTHESLLFFQQNVEKEESLFKVWTLKNLREIQKRRFLLYKNSLEIFLTNGKSILLKFESSSDRDQFAKKIVRQRNQKCTNLQYFDSLDPRKVIKRKELTEKWQNWKISNFEYLMQLNQLAGRSYNDLSQYPVLPWHLMLEDENDFSSDFKSQKLRDFSKNMAMLGSQRRKQDFQKKFEDSDNYIDEYMGNFHCGTHYSNPGIVLHYLARLSPFFDANSELHGQSLDSADRCFSSLQNSLYSALNDFADVRELIPQFFTLPETFQNLQNLNFGLKHTGEAVNDVLLPSWAENDPFLFCQKSREILEGEQVSSQLHKWIDLIFGCKQKGQEGEKMLNIFPAITYEDEVDTEEMDAGMLKSYEQQTYHFGMTPSQLFTKGSKHPQRLPKQQVHKQLLIIEEEAKVRVYKPVNRGGDQKQSPNPHKLFPEAIIKAKFITEQLIVAVSKEGTVTTYYWIPKAHHLNPQIPFTCSEEKIKRYDNTTKTVGGFDCWDRSLGKLNEGKTCVILGQGKLIARGGFWDGRITVTPVEQDLAVSYTQHQNTVICLESSKQEDTVVSGDKSGQVIVWEVQEQYWSVKRKLFDHECQVNHIAICEHIFVTAGQDGKCNLYTLAKAEWMRSFTHPSGLAINSVILSTAPLASLAFFSKSDKTWYSFSINGKFIESAKEETAQASCPVIVQDSQFNDRLIYGTEKGCVKIRKMPRLEHVSKIQVSKAFPILNVIPTPTKCLLVASADQSGGFNQLI